MHRELLEITFCVGLLTAVNVLLLVPGTSLKQELAIISSPLVEPAAIFFVSSTSSAEIRDSYVTDTSSRHSYASDRKVRILIVPGHRPDAGGTEFDGVYERDVVADIAQALGDLLANNSHYQVFIARGKKSWNPLFQTYFDTHAQAIKDFLTTQKSLMDTYIKTGKIASEENQVEHVTATNGIEIQLYGINKWASENAIDITLHLHLNDYAGRKAGRVGKHSGFAVYVPEHQYSNAAASKDIGDAIAKRLNAYHATSTLPQEQVGVIEDQELIAIGSNNTADDASVLIEYGYIYEPQFLNKAARSIAVKDYAYQTYLGLQDFFNDPVTPTSGSVSIPTTWSPLTLRDGVGSAEVYALQSALHYLGYYPPEGKSFNDCPISGVAGPCTRTALSEYQQANKITPVSSIGPKTGAQLTQDLSAL